MRRLPLLLLGFGSAALGSGASQAPLAPSIEAVGLVRSAVPTHSTAILRSQGRTRVVAIGETAFGARLVSIGAETVALELDGQPLELRLVPTPAVAAPPPPRASAPP